MVSGTIKYSDTSDTGAGKAVTLTYDDLYRLTSASTTAASSTPYSRTYAYNSIGTITSKSDQGSYTYNDDGYNNPHAADSINGTDLTYDNNGNRTTYGTTLYDWSYRNTLSGVGDGSAYANVKIASFR